MSAEDEGSIEEIDIELGMLLAGFSNACKVLKEEKRREEKRRKKGEKKRREVEKHRREKKRRVKRNSKIERHEN